MFFSKKMRKGHSKKKTIKGSGLTQPFVNKKNRLIGSGKTITKQKSGFLGPLLAALVPTATQLVTKLIK